MQVLRDRLSTVRQASKDAAYSDLQGRMHALAEQLRVSNEEEAKALQQVTNTGWLGQGSLFKARKSLF